MSKKTTTFPVDVNEFLQHIERLDTAKDREALLEVIADREAQGMRETEVLRVKLRLLYRRDPELAYDLARELSLREDKDPHELFRAGLLAAEFGHYADAEQFTSAAIDMEKKLNRPWYSSACTMIRAYARFRLGKFDLSKSDLDELEDDMSLIGMTRLDVTKESLLRELGQKKGKAGGCKCGSKNRRS